MIEHLKVVKYPRTLYSYPSPEWATAELLKRLPLEHGDVILDPASGNNAIAKVIKDYSNSIHLFTNDINTEQQADFNFDMTLRESWKWLERSTGGFDWVIGHPPFTSLVPPGKRRGKPILHIFLQMGYQYARKGIVYLLSKSFTEPVCHRRFWLQTYSHEQFMELRLERIRNKSGTIDEVACDWYGWQHGHTGGFVPEYIWRSV